MSIFDDDWDEYSCSSESDANSTTARCSAEDADKDVKVGDV
jgi:hypothetical protein